MVHRLTLTLIFILSMAFDAYAQDSRSGAAWGCSAWFR